ncbi:MAG: hypothetical protein ACK56I_11190, partial [bacterium]
MNPILTHAIVYGKRHVGITAPKSKSRMVVGGVFLVDAAVLTLLFIGAVLSSRARHIGYNGNIQESLASGHSNPSIPSIVTRLHRLPPEKKPALPLE